MSVSAPPASGTEPVLDFGHDALLARVQRRLRENLAQTPGQPDEQPPLVVGLFGEWGSGKSHLLEAVGRAVAAWPKQPAEHNVVVHFNAWRYEREEHVLIPLLKVAQQALLKSLEGDVTPGIRQREKISDRALLLGDLASSIYAHGGKEALQMLWRLYAGGAAGDSLLAALGPGSTGASAGDKTPPAREAAWKAWQKRQKALNEARRLPTPMDALHSLYFDFQEHLKAVTGRNPKAFKAHQERLTQGGSGWWPLWVYRAKRAWRWLQRPVLEAFRKETADEKGEVTLRVNLVFLVDDLDRCLPDKAVEVLEAIKLFLEVPGCVFVLALDEEVVERGIAHRYRDYALQGKPGLTPITGAEYLEKLVHLPVRLPRPTVEQALPHLLRLDGGLFRDAQGQPNELAQLVTKLTPAVPRKYQRMATMVGLAQGLMRDQRMNWRAGKERWLVLMCALQLFAPGLFRHLRVAGAGLLVEAAGWRPRELMDPAWQRGRLERRLWACEDVAQAQPLRAQMRLAELTAEAVNNRSGFDLMGVLAEVNALQANPKTALTEAQLAQLLALTQTLGEDAAAGAVPVQAGRPEFAQLADEERLFEAFSSGDLVDLQAALEQEREALQGRLLPDGMVMWWLERENTLAWWRSEPPAPQAGELWAALGPYLSQWGVLRLAAGLGVGVLKLIQGIPWIKDCDVKADGQQLQLSLSCEGGHLIRVDIPAGPPKSDSKWWRCASGQGEIPGAYFDVKVSGVVQRFRWIEPGSFLMGSPETEPNRSSDEGPQHRVTLTRGFWLADTACTQALWLAVVGGKNPSHFKGNDELPVEQVSWDDVMEKFMPKLQELLPQGAEATLPSEAQWEYACRAGTSTAYVWGDEVSPQLANIDTRQTTPVKTYPANPWGLFDMHGNVWEWCFDGRRTYAEGEVVDPLGAVGDGPRALRGGSWDFNAGGARSAYRSGLYRGWRSGSFGFRLALRFKPSK